MITRAKLNSVALIGLLAGMGALPKLPPPPNKGSAPLKDINSTPHQGNRERARRIRQRDKSLQVVR